MRQQQDETNERGRVETERRTFIDNGYAEIKKNVLRKIRHTEKH